MTLLEAINLRVGGGKFLAVLAAVGAVGMFLIRVSLEGASLK